MTLNLIEKIQSAIYSPNIAQNRKLHIIVLTFQYFQNKKCVSNTSRLQKSALYADLYGNIYILCWGPHNLTSLVHRTPFPRPLFSTPRLYRLMWGLCTVKSMEQLASHHKNKNQNSSPPIDLEEPLECLIHYKNQYCTARPPFIFIAGRLNAPSGARTAAPALDMFLRLACVST